MLGGTLLPNYSKYRHEYSLIFQNIKKRFYNASSRQTAAKLLTMSKTYRHWSIYSLYITLIN